MSKKKMKAITALEEANKIALSPFLFQSAVSLKKLGVLDFIFESRQSKGITLEFIANTLSIPSYGLGVLLEMAESADIVQRNNFGEYTLTKTGYFLTYNKMIEVNMNFTNDVCYNGLFHLKDAIKNGTPEGLHVFGSWETIYDGLSQLEPHVQKSWFAFDHHYSDEIFDEVMEFVFRNNPKTIFDIGGNTGKFALSCCSYNANVSVVIFDLPGQLTMAEKTITSKGFKDRVSFQEINWLSEKTQISGKADIIWMSQFLDCFSEESIIKILKACKDAMDINTEIMIVETFTDRQRFDNAKYTLEATSLYFAAMANGNSKMYTATKFMELIDKAGLIIVEDKAVSKYHTLLVCKL